MKTEEKMVKIVVLGSDRVGKSAFIRRYIDGDFIPMHAPPRFGKLILQDLAFVIKKKTL